MTSLEWVRGDWMQTFTGGRFYPLDPSSAEVNSLDIAHSLSLQCRYGGHVDRFYSVAEHSVLMSLAVDPGNAIHALLHDATEAYVIDVPRPLKRQLPGYKEIENAVWWAIAIHFGIDFVIPDEVKEADTRILLTERNVLMPRHDLWSMEHVEPLPVEIQCWSPEVAESKFIERLTQLTRENR